jgi:ferredoxin-NADP reductase
MLDTAVPAASSVIAFVTAVHAALLVVHLERVRGLLRLAAALPCVAFAALAWVLTTPPWLAAGVAANLAWTIAVSVLARPSERAGSQSQLEARTPPEAGAGRAAALGSPRPGTFVPATVLAVIEETETIRTFRLARPAGFEFEAGQFVMVQLPLDGAPASRCYSISSPPSAAGVLEISVRRQGRVSAALHETLRAGGTLLVHPPLGRFALPAAATAPLVMLAGGIGITPFVSMVRQVVACQPERGVLLVYSVRGAGDAAFREELELLARRHPQFRLVITVTGEEAGRYRRGRVDEALVRDLVPDPAHALFLLCGPAGMLDGVRATLAGLGVPPAAVRCEAFEAAAALASGTGRREAGAPGRLQLARTGREVEVLPGESLLDAAERAGASFSSFCRAGICGTCRTRLVSGQVSCEGEALTDRDRQDGYVLPCVSVAAGDCVLEA